MTEEAYTVSGASVLSEINKPGPVRVVAHDFGWVQVRKAEARDLASEFDGMGRVRLTVHPDGWKDLWLTRLDE
jgi:hypothetical protein